MLLVEYGLPDAGFWGLGKNSPKVLPFTSVLFGSEYISENTKSPDPVSCAFISGLVPNIPPFVALI